MLVNGIYVVDPEIDIQTPLSAASRLVGPKGRQQRALAATALAVLTKENLAVA